ncbi:MAG: hypothetical protein LBB38_00855 [Puniceicoccales bacterium]|jgi:hypothetical protein|nr:hypothetical protein [Puniceicoccales bacterium]
MTVDDGQRVEVSNFVGTFCLPFICAAAAVTLPALVERVVVAKVATGCLLPTRSFGQWVALICLSVLTVGIVWIVAKAIVGRDMKKDGSAVKVIYDAAKSSAPAAAPSLPTKDADGVVNFFIRPVGGGTLRADELFKDLLLGIRHGMVGLSNGGLNVKQTINDVLLCSDEEKLAAIGNIAEAVRELINCGIKDRNKPNRQKIEWTGSSWDGNPKERNAFCLLFLRAAELDECSKTLERAIGGSSVAIAYDFPSCDGTNKSPVCEAIANALLGEPAKLVGRICQILVECGFDDAPKNEQLANAFIGKLKTAMSSAHNFNGTALLSWLVSGKDKLIERFIFDSMQGIVYAKCVSMKTRMVKPDVYGQDVDSGKMDEALDKISQFICGHLRTAADAVEDMQVKFADKGSEITTTIGERIAEVVKNDERVKHCIKCMNALSTALDRAENLPDLDIDSVGAEETPPAAKATIGDFARVFVYPFVRLKSSAPTDAETALASTVEPLSFGDWTARILLTVLTVGIIWIAAYVCFVLRFSAKKDTCVKALEASQAQALEAGQTSTIDALARAVDYFFEWSWPKKTFHSKLTHLITSTKYYGRIAMFSDGVLRVPSAEACTVKENDARSNEEIVSDFSAAIEGNFNGLLCIKLKTGIDLTKDPFRSEWNWFVRELWRSGRRDGMTSALHGLQSNILKAALCEGTTENKRRNKEIRSIIRNGFIGGVVQFAVSSIVACGGNDIPQDRVANDIEVDIEGGIYELFCSRLCARKTGFDACGELEKCISGRSPFEALFHNCMAWHIAIDETAIDEAVKRLAPELESKFNDAFDAAMNSVMESGRKCCDVLCDALGDIAPQIEIMKAAIARLEGDRGMPVPSRFLPQRAPSP